MPFINFTEGNDYGPIINKTTSLMIENLSLTINNIKLNEQDENTMLTHYETQSNITLNDSITIFCIIMILIIICINILNCCCGCYK